MTKEDYTNVQLENEEYMPKEMLGFGFELGKPRESDRNKIFETVYNEMTRGKKKHFGSAISRKAIKQGRHSMAAELLDPQYADAKEEVTELYSRLFRNFIGLYSYKEGQKDNLIAFTSLPGLVTLKPDDKLSMRAYFGKDEPFIVNDLFVVDADGYEQGIGDSDVVSNLFNLMLQRLEAFILSVLYDEEVTIDFRTLGNNGPLWDVLAERGYEVQNSEDLVDQYRFTKVLKKREDVNEGNNSRK